MFTFEKLIVWQKATNLVTNVYALTKKFPNHETFGLANQIQRAVVSVPSNIAEGSGRPSVKEKIHFLEISYGSLMEVYCQLQIVVNLNYITSTDFDSLKPEIESIAKMLTGMRRSWMERMRQ